MGAGSFNPNGGTGTIGGTSYSYSPVSQSTSNNAVPTVSPAMGQNPDGTWNYGTPQQNAPMPQQNAPQNAPMPQQGGTSQNGNFADIYDPTGSLSQPGTSIGASNTSGGSSKAFGLAPVVILSATSSHQKILVIPLPPRPILTLPQKIAKSSKRIFAERGKN